MSPVDAAVGLLDEVEVDMVTIPNFYSHTDTDYYCGSLIHWVRERVRERVALAVDDGDCVCETVDVCMCLSVCTSV